MGEQGQVSAGAILGGAFERLGAHREAVLLYLGIFVLLGTLANYLDFVTGQVDPGASGFDDLEPGFAFGGFGVLYLVAGTVGHFWLFGRLLDTPQAARVSDVARWLPFIGLAIVSWLGVGVATIFLIFPGLFVGARWLMSPAIFVDRRTGVFEALGASWNATRGNTTPVLLALLVLAVMLVVTAAVLGALTMFGNSVVTAFVDALVTELFAVLAMGLSVATYRIVMGSDKQLVDIFA